MPITREEYELIQRRMMAALPARFTGAEAMEVAVREFQGEEYRMGFAVGTLLVFIDEQEATTGDNDGIH